MATVKGHKKYLDSLEETDPEFFAFLKENDSELLNFEDSDKDDEDSDEEEDQQVHKPPAELEVASDSEAEEELVDEKSEEHKKVVAKTLQKRIINLHLIADWEKKLSSTKELAVLTDVIDGLESAVDICLLGKEGAHKWKIEGSTNFNALVRLCIRHVKSFCVRFLCASNNTALAENMFDSKPFDTRDKYKLRWKKLRPKIKAYMTTLTTFLKSMGNPEAIATVLRHCQKMSGFWALLGSKSFKFTRVLVNLWSQGEDSVRVLAFLTLMRMTHYSKDVFLERFMKQMYIAYVANSKFTSVSSWPLISFMRHCLVELYIVDTAWSYYLAFPFIRQLAIHLRNAVTAGTGIDSNAKNSKVEASRIVYSWQFVHSVHLWVDLLSETAKTADANLKLLIHPIVQICLGTIKLIPSKKFIPLRFHIARMLTKLQEKTKTFIPVLPIITEALLMTDFSAKSVQKFSVRPLDFTCCLKADPSESGYLKALSENAFECILRACTAMASELSFPEVVTPATINLKRFLKKQCKNPEVSKKFKVLVDKIEENSKYVKSFRDKALEGGQVSLSDQKKIQILRVQMETSDPPPPLLAFAADYLKLNKREQAKLQRRTMETKEEKLIPKLSAKQQFRKRRQADINNDGPLFGSDDEEDDEDFETMLDEKEENEEEEEVDVEAPKPKKKKKNLKNGLESEEQEGGKKVKTKKAKKSLRKKQKMSLKDDAKDELVDLDLSD